MVLEVLRKSISSHRQKGDPIRGQPSIRKKRECDEEVSTPTTRAHEARSSVSAICLRFRGWSCKAAKRNVTHTNRCYVQRLRFLVCSFLLAFLWLLRKSPLLVAFKKVFAQTRIFKRQRNNNLLSPTKRKQPVLHDANGSSVRCWLGSLSCGSGGCRCEGRKRCN